MKELVDEPDATPSARLLAELREQGMSFFDYAYATAHKHRDYFDAITPMPDERYSEFEAEVLRSIERQNEIEASDRISFDQYLANYFAQ
jgi:glutamate--cysteine ligase